MLDRARVTRLVEEALDQHRPAFGEFFLARFLDLQISYGDETCRVAVPAGRHLNNPQGSLHGGVIVLAMDVSMGHLCHRFLSTAVTLEFKVNFLRPIHGDCWCEARFLKKGRRVLHLESRLHDEQDRLAAVTTATWMRLSGTAADEEQTTKKGRSGMKL